MFLYHFSPIRKQIEQYVAWKAIRYPYAALEHGRVLTEFFQKVRLPCVTKISAERIRTHAETFSSTYQREKFLKVIRQFCKYWYDMGLMVRRFASIVQQDIIEDMADIHPLLHTERVREVHRLKRQGLSYRQIVILLESKHKRKYDVRQIWQWHTKYTQEGKAKVPRKNRTTKVIPTSAKKEFDIISQ